MSAKGDYYAAGANMYVKNLTYAADTNGLDGKPYFDLGVLNAASATNILNAQSIAAGPTLTAFNGGWNSPVADMGKFGRCLQYVLSGAGTPTITARGFDYLGQPMTEQVTGNGTTAVNGTKAFRRITSITAGATAVNISVGTRDALGLPYAIVGDVVDYTDGVRSGTQGTIVVAPLTAQTISSADPRGTFAPNQATNGSRRYTMTFEPLRGNLYGNAHFYS